MNKKSYFVFFIVLLCVVLAGYQIRRYYGNDKSPSLPVEEISAQKDTIAPFQKKEPSQNTSVQDAYPSDLWEIFTQYVERAQQHDISGISRYSFYLSDACKNSKEQDDCFTKMDALVDAAKPLAQKDFVNEWKDEKQAILSTNFKPYNGGVDLGYARSVIVFGKDKDNRYKILALNPQQLWQIKRNAASSTEEVEKKLSLMIRDADQDGVTDEFENCIFPENLLVVSCTKTDPKKKDTNGDGWWDGVEMYIQK